jgi:hypothetical protein
MRLNRSWLSCSARRINCDPLPANRLAEGRTLRIPFQADQGSRNSFPPGQRFNLLQSAKPQNRASGRGLLRTMSHLACSPTFPDSLSNSMNLERTTLSIWPVASVFGRFESVNGPGSRRGETATGTRD